MWGKTFNICQTGRHSFFVKLFPVGFIMEFVLESNFFWRKIFVLFIAFSKRFRWAEMECHLSLLEQRKIDRAKNDQSFTSFEYKKPNKIVKTFQAKISGRAMIQVAFSSFLFSTEHLGPWPNYGVDGDDYATRMNL